MSGIPPKDQSSPPTDPVHFNSGSQPLAQSWRDERKQETAQPQSTSPRYPEWSDRTKEWLARANGEGRKSVFTQPLPDYAVLNGLQIICLIGAALSPIIGLVISMDTASAYHFFMGLLSGVSRLLTAAWIGLAIDIARHTKQTASELVKLRQLLAGQSATSVRGKV
jgi:hypothetical protein